MCTSVEEGEYFIYFVVTFVSSIKIYPDNISYKYSKSF